MVSVGDGVIQRVVRRGKTNMSGIIIKSTKSEEPRIRLACGTQGECL